MAVYRYILKDKSLPSDRNTVYCLITEQKKDIVFEIENFISTTEMLENDKRKNDKITGTSMEESK